MKRPTGITLSSFILFVLGFFYFIAVVLTLASIDEMGIVSIIPSVLICVITVMSGIGLLRGKKWGWWMAAIYSSMLTSHIISIILSHLLFKPTIIELIQQLPIMIIILLVLVINLFNNTSMLYCGFANKTKKKVIKIICITTVVLLIFMLIRSYLFW